MNRDNLLIDVGTSLQMELLSGQKNARFNVSLIGYVSGISLLVSYPESSELRSGLLDGDELAMRFMNGSAIYGFKTYITRICTDPFKYIHLKFPDKIETAKVRSAQRVRSIIPVSIKGRGNSVLGMGEMTDVSVDGAGFNADTGISETGDELVICTSLAFGEIHEEVELKAIVRSITNINGSGKSHYGIEFGRLDKNEELFLRGFVYEQIVQSRD